MSTQSDYWSRALSRRSSRRRVLAAGVSGGVGAVGLGLVGCGDDDDDNGNGASPTATMGNGSASPSATGAASPTGTGAMPGGAMRSAGSTQVFDTFDFNRTQFSTVLFITNAAYEKVVQWDSFVGGPQAGGGIAESWEQPDLEHITFKVRENAFWHDKPPVGGRQTNAQDIAYHIERNRDGVLSDGTEDPNFYRHTAYESTVDTVDVVDDMTVTVNFKKPSPRFINLLAQSFELVQAPEAVEAFEGRYNTGFGPELLIGTGPYVVNELTDTGDYRFDRFDQYHRETYLDSVLGVALSIDSAARQVAFEQKQIDSFNPPTQATYDDLVGRFGDDVYNTATFSALNVGGYYNGAGAPWNNPNLIGAIFRALDRRQLIQQLYGGRGLLSAQVLPIHTGFNIPESELITYPGYLEDHAEDVAEAKLMWEAGGGPELGEITLDVADLWVNCCGPNGPELFQSQLNTALGTDQFVARLDTYPNILGTKFAGGQYGNGNNAIALMGNIPQAVDPDPTDQLIQFFRTDQGQAALFGTNIPGLDDVLFAADVELELEARQELIKEADRLLLTGYGGGIINTMATFSNQLYWGYRQFVGERETSPFGTGHLVYREWIDTTHPSYQGRPATS